MKPDKKEKVLNVGEGRNISLYQLLWLFISTISLSGIALLWIASYSPFKAIISGIILAVITVLVLRWRIEIPRVKFSKLVIIFIFILVSAFALRVSPWMYLEGGQDEGLYVSMSKQFDRTGKLKFDDITTSKLKGKDLKRYTREKGWQILGLRRDEKGDLYYGFYPLHPMVMSITGSVLGENNMTSSLTLFAILSIVGMFLLTKELSGSKLAGVIGASLLAFSPLHLYFSRFPVTEVLALAFTLNAFYFMLMAYKTKRWSYLFLALLIINMFFYTRITWIISLPFYVVTILVLLTYLKEKKERIMWGIWGMLVLITYLLSLYFYNSQIQVLYLQFYLDIFHYIPKNTFFTLIGLIPVVILIFSTVLRKYTKWILEFVVKFKNPIIYIILLMMVFKNVEYFYEMAYTDMYVGSPYDYFWGMANKGWVIFKDMALMSLILYLTPVGVILFALSVKKVATTPARLLLMLFVILFMFLSLVINKFTPYHFYYARYQLSEIIPVIYIFISIYLVDLFKRKKFWFYLCFGFLTLYNLFFVAFQYQGYVGTTPEMFNNLQKTVDKDDLVIYHDPTEWAPSFIMSPLKYFYNIPAQIADTQASIDFYIASSEEYDFDRYILSTVKLENEGIDYIKTLTFKKGFYASINTEQKPLEMEINEYKIPYCDRIIDEKFCSGIIPIRYHLGSIPLYLYKIK